MTFRDDADELCRLYSVPLLRAHARAIDPFIFENGTVQELVILLRRARDAIARVSAGATPGDDRQDGAEDGLHGQAVAPSHPAGCVVTAPHFRVDKSTNPPRVFIQCSHEGCDKDVRELKPHQSVPVTRAYFCPEHDTGAIVLNPPRREP